MENLTENKLVLLVGNSIGNTFPFVLSHKKMGNKEKVLSRLYCIKNQSDLNIRRQFIYRFHNNNHYLIENETREIIPAQSFFGKGEANYLTSFDNYFELSSSS